MDERDRDSVFETEISSSNVGVVGINYGPISIRNAAASTLDPNVLSLRTGILNFLDYYLGTPERPVPFGGRDDDLQRLENWRTGSEKQFLLIAAPAGRGKSALLTHWARQLDTEEMRKKVATVFVPISGRHETMLQSDVFPCIVAQLAALAEKKPPAHSLNLSTNQWKGFLGDYLREPLPDGRQLIIILDGLDEAVPQILSNPFPNTLPLNVKVVVSARYLGNEDEGPGPWLNRLGWDRLALADDMTLENLTRGGMEDVLLQMGNPLDVLAESQMVTRELYRVTNGDPLLVELYVNWLFDKGEDATQLEPNELAEIEPSYTGFFDHWWDTQERLWAEQEKSEPLEKEAVLALLSILATAFGPLTGVDLRELAPDIFTGMQSVRNAVRPLRRMVVGKGTPASGYVFSHPKLRDHYLLERLDAQDRFEWSEVFLKWGDKVIEALQSDDAESKTVSSYLLQYYSEHLAVADAPAEAYLRLLTREWMQAWFRYTRTFAEFLSDAERVLEVLVSEDEKATAQGRLAPFLDKEILCVLSHASVNSLSDRYSSELLVALREYGDWTDEQVLAYAYQKSDARLQAETLIAVAPALEKRRASQAYGRALELVKLIKGGADSAELLCLLAPHLPEEIFEVAESVRNDSQRTDILAAVAPYLPRAVLGATQTMQNEWHRGEVLIALAPHLPEAVYDAAQSIQSDWVQTRVLISSGAYLPTKLQEAATQRTMMSVEGWRWRDWYGETELFMNLIPSLMSEQADATLLQKVVTALASYPYARFQQVEFLTAAASFLPEDVLEAAQDMRDELDRAKVLIALAPLLPEAVFEAAQEIHAERARAKVIIALAPHLPEAVFEAAAKLSFPGDQGLALAAVALHLEAERREIAFQQALKAAEADIVERSRAEVLSVLAPHLPEQVYEQAQHYWYNERSRTEVLIALLPHLSAEQEETTLQQLLEAARRFHDKGDRADYLIGLVPYLGGLRREAALRQAREMTQGISDEGHRAILLSALAPHLPELVFESAQRFENEYVRVLVLIALAPHLPKAVHKAAQVLQDEESRNILLSVLAPDVPEVAIEVVQGVEDYGLRAKALVDIAPRLPEVAFEAVQGLPYDRHRAEVLTALAPKLPNQVYEAAQVLQDEGSRAKVLSALALQMPEAVYEAAQTLHFERHVAWVLVALAPHLPDKVYATANRLTVERPRAQALGALAPHLAAGQHETELLHMLEVAQDTRDKKTRVELLTALLPHLPTDYRDGVLQQVLGAAQNTQSRVATLFKFALPISATEPLSAYRAWWVSQRDLAKLPRGECYQIIGEWIPVIENLGGEEALEGTLRAVEDVARWWP